MEKNMENEMASGFYKGYMSYSLKSLMGLPIEDFIGDYYGSPLRVLLTDPE